MTAVRRFLAGFMRKIRTIDIGSAALSLTRTTSAIGRALSKRTLARAPSMSIFVLALFTANPATRTLPPVPGLDCVFFQPFGGAVGINSHYFTFEFGFEGLCRYIPPPPAATTATTVSRNRNFLSICLSIEFYVDAKIAFSSVFQTDRSNYSICVYIGGGKKRRFRPIRTEGVG